MRSESVKKLALCALSCAFVLAATLLYIPAPVVGNVNLGDCALLLCAFLIGGVPTAIACGLGAALADLITGYAIYVPATFCIKVLMGLCALGILTLAKRIKLPALPARLIAAFLAEAVMILGYWGYEATVLSYGWIASAANIPFNAIQGTAALLVSTLAFPILQKAKPFRPNDLK